MLYLRGPFRIYNNYLIVPYAILPNSATKAIEFYVQDFLRKYTIPFRTHGPLFKGVQTNREHQENQKEILINPGATAE